MGVSLYKHSVVRLSSLRRVGVGVLCPAQRGGWGGRVAYVPVYAFNFGMQRNFQDRGILVHLSCGCLKFCTTPSTGLARAFLSLFRAGSCIETCKNKDPTYLIQPVGTVAEGSRSVVSL